MAKQTKKREKPLVKVNKIPTKTYIIKNRVKVNGEWLEEGDKIKLTLDGATYFKETHKI